MIVATVPFGATPRGEYPVPGPERIFRFVVV